jgi:hypothetical protein
MVALSAAGCLRGDGLDQVDHDADARRVVGEAYGGVGGAGFRDRERSRRAHDLAASLISTTTIPRCRRRRSTLTEVSSAAEATALTSALDWSAEVDMLCAVDCIELADVCRLSSARTVVSNSTCALPCAGALGLGDAVLVLVGGHGAGGDRSRNTCSDSDISAISSFWAGGRSRSRGRRWRGLHRALQRADAAQDAAADIEPDEQHRADQRATPSASITMVASEISSRACAVAVSVSLRTPSTNCCTLMPRPIELAGLFEYLLVGGVELLLADLEDAFLALAERRNLATASPMVLPPAPFGSISTLDLTFWIVSLILLDRLSVSLLLADSAAAMFDVIRLPPAITLPSCSTMRAAAVAASMTGSTAVSMALSRLWASNISGSANHEVRLRLAQRLVLLVVRRRRLEPLACRRGEILVMSSIFFTVSVSAVTMVLSAPSAMTSLSLASAVACVSLIFLRRSFSASSVRTASTAALARKSGALRRAAGSRPAADVRAGEVDHYAAEVARAPGPRRQITMAMPAMMAKAVNKLPRTPNFGRRFYEIEFADRNAKRHRTEPIRYLKVNRGGTIAVPG